ncbi:undecaprenyl-phosphate glucose phosphotransferase, partial [Pseudomonas syringae pv. tagetis]
MRTSVRGILHAHQSTLSLAHRLLDLIIIVLICYWQTGLTVADSTRSRSQIVQ